jgi:hypothetical protein
MTLVEVLVSAAITVTVATVVTSILMTVMASGRRLQNQTDQYESLRLAADLFTQDARFALYATCDPFNFVKLNTNSTGTDYVYYTFAFADGTPDDHDLHRWVIQGGGLMRDDIVGRDLVPPDLSWGAGSEFGCTSYSQDRQAYVRLVKPPLRGQTQGTQIFVTAFQR